MDVTELNKRISHLQNKLDELKDLKAAYESVISKQELLDKYDFDGDGVISSIDIHIPAMAILGDLNGDPLYNKNNQTYKGKSLDINSDGKTDILDPSVAVKTMLNEIQGIYDVEFWAPTVLDNDGTELSIADNIRKLYNQKGKVLPTLQELKDHVKQYNS